MIPLRLTVNNFMCYRDNVPTLELEGVHVACLCGDNGHGKTALLDAITWALWGQARARTQDELVHQGQQDMAVELEFLARGQRYRVSRRHSRSARSRQGTTILELQVASDNGYRPISGNSVRETEGRIRETLHMDYETFISTAFLRQGDADRFTTSTPARRKEHLAEVLDLSYHEALEERAKARGRIIQEQIVHLDSAISLREEEMAARPQHEAELASVVVTLGRITPEAESQWLTVEELRQSVELLRGRNEELAELGRLLDRGRREIAQIEGQLRNHEARVSEYEASLQRESEIQEEFSRLQESRAELGRLDEALARKSALDQEKAPAEREVAVQKERLLAHTAQLRKSIAGDLEPKANSLAEIEKELREVAEERASLADLEESLRKDQQEAQSIAATIHELELANGRLLQEMEDTRKKFDMLEHGDTLCPLCKQPLGAEGQEHLRREYESQGVDRKRQYQDNLGEQKVLEPKRRELTARMSQLEAGLEQGRQRTENRIANLQRDKAESLTAQAELQKAAAILQEVETLLSSENFANDERRKLSRLDAELLALGYDADTHRRSREQVRALHPYDELRRRLLEAAERLPPEREALEAARRLLEGRREEAREAEKRKSALEEELKTLPSLRSRLEEAQARHQKLYDQRQAAVQRQAVLEDRIERCLTAQREVRQQERERRSAVDEKSIYDELATAFGKNGIQALIIEAAIPQLEADANELLGRLTEHRMSLKLQLQEGRRDSRTGLPSEELDIKIADEVGTRSYETFSGGEAFRIDFGLRIALSKLLARRSGAPLPILFIDEGFGSQDSAGQERLTEAIRSIQDDFQKIIVITHIDAIKEAFPVRIEVTKTGAGSTFEVV